ncbi:MAG: type II secretion system protein [bacterium]|nr:type II secretion system protein [bacterium]
MKKCSEEGFTLTLKMALRQVFYGRRTRYNLLSVHNCLVKIKNWRRNTMPSLVRGFTLTELLVSISIMTLMSTLIIFNFPKFNEQIAMNRAARELSSTLREAQARAVGIVAFPGLATPNNFPNNYGVYVTSVAPDNDTFFIFSDLDCNGKYTSSIASCGLCPIGAGWCTIGFDEVVPLKKFQFQRGVHVFRIESTEPLNMVPTSLHVLSYRPGPDTIITGPNGVQHRGFGPFAIMLQSADESIKKTVCIWTTGQISIKSGAGC